MTVYNLSNGDTISVNDFIRIYSQMYYLSTNYKVETRIERILQNGIQSIDDLRDVIGWKTGCILMKESYTPEHDAITFREGYLSEQLNHITLYGRLISLETLFLTYNSESDEKLYYSLNNINGIGPVYAICLLFFKNPYKFPIYDRFADISLKAMQDEKIALWGEVKYRMPENIESAWRYYQEYVRILNTIFPEWREDRNIDRALWTYGHLFKEI